MKDDNTQSEVLAGGAVMPIAVIGIPKVDLGKLTIVTPDKFAELQKAHGRLYVLDIKVDEDEQYQFISKRPTKSLLSAVADSKDDLNAANELMIKNMIVAGDLAILEDGVVYNALMKEIANIMKQGKSFLSKA